MRTIWTVYSFQLRSLPDALDDDDSSVPDLLRPAVQRYAAQWTATQERHDMNTRKAKLIDVQLRCLRESLYAHLETGQALSREMALLQETKKHIAQISDEATGMEAAFIALERLYTSLAAADTKRADELAHQESEHRRIRHQHYLQLQQEMDSQYEELQRNSVHARAAHAERSFQQDLEMYRQMQSQATPGGLAQQQGKSRRRGNNVTGIADVVLSVGDWGSASVQDDSFFSDDEDTTTTTKASQPLPPNQASRKKIAKMPETDTAAAAALADSSSNTSGGTVSAHGAKEAATTIITKHQRPPRQPASPEPLSTVRRHHHKTQQPQPQPTAGSSEDDEDSPEAIVILEDEDFI
ncbi:hypothetical protein EV178_004127 [Coemansia sp. RSA 1646]|nr:hypothetical protein EV178_004127 [Coemansia sp. RSA 1646]